MSVVPMCFAWAPTETFVMALPPWVSTGGEARPPAARLPWQNVQLVAQADPWQFAQDWAEPPVRLVPWQLLHEVRPDLLTE